MKSKSNTFVFRIYLDGRDQAKRPISVVTKQITNERVRAHLERHATHFFVMEYSTTTIRIEVLPESKGKPLPNPICAMDAHNWMVDSLLKYGVITRDFLRKE